MNGSFGVFLRLLWYLPAILWVSLVSLVQWFIPLSWYAKDVSKEIVLITGAGSGLGRQLAIEYAQLNASLVLWDINVEGMNETKKLVEQEHNKLLTKATEGRGGGQVSTDDIDDESRFCLTYRVDVSNREEVYAQASQVQKDLARMGDNNNKKATASAEASSKYVSILVNNAGIYHGLALQELSDEQIERIFKINIIAHFWTVRAFLPKMIERQHGHIVEIASMGGIAGFVKQVDYCATKFATIGFEESINLELVALGLGDKIHTTAICPFFFRSNLFTGFNADVSPIMSCRYVAHQAVMGMRCNHSRVLLPPSSYVIYFVRPFTSRRGIQLWSKVLNLFEAIRDIKGSAAC